MKMFAWVPTRLRWAVRFMFILMLVGGIGTVLYVNSRSFEHDVRNRFMSAIQKATDAEVEMDGFHLHPFLLSADVEGLVLRARGEGKIPPYAEFEKIHLRVKVISIFSGKYGLSELTITHPVFRLQTAASGAVSQPLIPGPPSLESTTGHATIVEPLFDASMDQFTVHGGQIIYRDQSIPFDFTASDVDAALQRSAVRPEYFGHLAASTSFQWGGGVPLRTRLETTLSFDHTHAEFPEMLISTRTSRIQAYGSVADLLKPILELDFKSHAETNETAGLLHLPAMHGGTAEINGHASISSTGYKFRGHIVTQGLGWHDSNVSAQSTGTSAQFLVDRNEFTMNDIFAQVEGGTVRGNITVHNWLGDKVEITKKGPVHIPASGEAQFTTTGLDAGHTFISVSQPWLPLNKLNAAGSISGTMGIHWKGPFDTAQWNYALEITPSVQVQEHQTSLQASLHGMLIPARQLLQADEFRVHTPHSQFNAHGPLGPGETAMTLDATADSMEEWQPLLTGDKPFPITLLSRATFHGQVTGTLAAPEFQGSVHTGPLHAKIGDQDWPFDTFTGDAFYSAVNVKVTKAEISRGQTAVIFSGTASLENWTLQQDGAFSLDAATHGFSVDEAQRYLKWNEPVHAPLTAKTSLVGTLLDFRGHGEIDLGAGDSYGEQLISAHSEYQFRAGSQSLNMVEFKNMSVRHPGGNIQGDLSYDRSTGALNYNVKSDDFDMSRISHLKNDRFPFEGHAHVDAHGSGTWNRPILNATVNIQNMKLTGEWLGDFDAQVQTRGGELKLTAGSHLIYAQFSAEGKVQMNGDLPGKVDIHCTGFNIEPIVKALSQGKLNGTSSVNGSFTVQGPWRHPNQLTMQGVVDKLEAQVEDVKLSSEGNIKFSADGTDVRTDGMHIIGKDTDLNISGEVPWNTTNAIDLRADGTANLKLFQGYSPDLRSSGSVHARMHVTGNRLDPNVTGGIDVQDANISFIDLPNGLTGLNGRMVFNQDRLEIISLNAKTGGGTVKLGGFITYHDELFFDLTVEGRDIRFRYPAGISSAGDADLHFTGTTRSSQLNGTITVNRLGVNPHFDFAQYIIGTQSTEKNALPLNVPQGVLDTLRLDVAVVSASDLRVVTSLAQISGNAVIRLRGTAARPVVMGRVNIASGSVYFNGTTYRLERGDIVFTNPVKTEAVLNLEASARVRDYDITVGLHGPMNHISVNYRSEPPLPGGDIIALLALGRTREDAVLYNQPTTSITNSDTDAVLGEALNATLSSRAQKLFGLSRIKIDPQVGGPEDNPNARITIEQPVKNNLTLTYISSLSQSAQQIIQAEYAINPDLSLIIVRDQYGVLGFDVRIRKRKK